VRGCESIVGREDLPGAPGSVGAEAEETAAPLEASGGGRR
jgi:hypothetical protein